MVKKGNCSAGVLIAVIHKLFLGCEIAPLKLENYIKYFLENKGKLDDIVVSLIQSEQRRDLLASDPFYMPCELVASAKIMKYLEDYIDNPVIINTVMQECFIAERKFQAAIDAFKTDMNYALRLQAWRILMIASRINFIDYAYILYSISLAYWLTLPDVFMFNEFLHKQMTSGKKTLDCKTLEAFTANDILQAAEYAEAIYQNNLYDNDGIIRRILTVMELAHFPEMAIAKAKAIVNVICADPITQRPTSTSPKCRLIFVAGLWNSGASAIYDYLRSSRSCCDPFPQTEPSLFRQDIDLYSICEAMEKDIELLRKELLKAFLYQILNIKLASDLSSYNLQHLHAISKFYVYSEDAYADYLNDYEIFCRGVLYSYSRKDMDAFRHSVACFLDNLAKPYLTVEHKYIVLLNAVNAQLAHRLIAAPVNSIFIISFRNPKDQYCSCSKHANLSQFIAYENEALCSLEAAYRQLGSSCRFLPVSYEMFVKSESYRDALAAKLNIDASADGRPFFDPEFSITRIGRHKDHPDQASIQAAAAAFPQLMDNSFMDIFADNFLTERLWT